MAVAFAIQLFRTQPSLKITLEIIVNKDTYSHV